MSKLQTGLGNYLNHCALQKLLSRGGGWRVRLPRLLDFLQDPRKTPPTRDDVQIHKRKTPRFLFRAWKPSSGGPRSLNSARLMRPAFFRNPEILDKPGNPTTFTSFFDTSKHQLALQAKLHLRNVDDFDTCYSSWTQSLIWALAYYRTDPKDLHISVLDTASSHFDWDKTPVLSATRLGKVLGYNDFMQLSVSSSSPKGSLLDLPGYEHELLAYGPILYPAYRTVSWAKLQEAGIEKILPIRTGSVDSWSGSGYHIPKDPSKVLPVAIDCGRLFGTGFDLPVMAHVMACFHHDAGDHDKIVKKLHDVEVGESLYGVPAAFPKDIDYEGHEEAWRGDRILRDVVIGSKKFEALGDYKASTAEERIEEEKSQAQSQKRAMNSMLHDIRVCVPSEAAMWFKAAVVSDGDGNGDKKEGDGKKGDQD